MTPEDGNKIMSRHLLALLIPVLLLAPACGDKQSQRGKPVTPSIKVGTAVIGKCDIEETIELTGGLVFSQNTNVSAEVKAKITSIEVADGQIVKKGQVLLTLDDAELRDLVDAALAELKGAAATLDFDKHEWQKSERLVKTGAVGPSQYEQKLAIYKKSLSRLSAAKAQLATAMQRLAWTEVQAPIPGLVSKRYVELGDWVSPGTKVFRIGDYRKVYLDAFLSDLEVSKLDQKKIRSEGVDAVATVDALPGKTFKGKITYIEPGASKGKAFHARMYVDNPKMLLLEGMFARGRTVVGSKPDVLCVPLNALLEKLRKSGENRVFVVDKDKKARLRRIKIGLTDATRAEVLQGLKLGDVAVVYGKEILSDGQPVVTAKKPD